MGDDGSCCVGGNSYVGDFLVSLGGWFSVGGGLWVVMAVVALVAVHWY